MSEWTDISTYTKNARLREALEASTVIMSRYLKETPLGNQPDMIALVAELQIASNKQTLEKGE